MSKIIQMKIITITKLKKNTIKKLHLGLKFSSKASRLRLLFGSISFEPQANGMPLPLDTLCKSLVIIYIDFSKLYYRCIQDGT